MSKVLYLLTGPTASGKTAFGIQWAKANNAEILSCDSLLFYKGMDIGTAKPSEEEQREVIHHGIDILPVDKQFNIKSYCEFAKHTIQSIHAKGKQVLVVGGSGFYLKSFIAPVSDDIEISASINNYVLSIYENEGLEGLIKELGKLNPEGFGDLDICNPRRVLKALVRCLSSGKSLLELRKSFQSQTAPFAEFEKRVCILDRNPEVLKKRIEQRVFEMMELGLIKEVQGLIEQGIEKNPSAATAIGYRETIRWLKSGHDNEDDLAEAIILNTNKLVAKQRKWFRTQMKEAQVINLDEAVVPSQLL